MKPINRAYLEIEFDEALDCWIVLKEGKAIASFFDKGQAIEFVKRNS